jgi:hypothetical protein
MQREAEAGIIGRGMFGKGINQAAVFAPELCRAGVRLERKRESWAKTDLPALARIYGKYFLQNR